VFADIGGLFIFQSYTINPQRSFKMEKQKETLASYNRAYHQTTDPVTLAKTARNIAVSNWGIANESVKHMSAGRNLTAALFHFKDAVTFFDRAVSHGSAVMPDKWKASLKTAFNECLHDVIQFAELEDDPKKRISALETFKFVICYNQEYKTNLCIELAQQIFKLGLTFLQEENYNKALYLMKECYQPVEEARQFAGGRQDILSEVEVLQEDIFMAQCRAESIKSRKMGDELLRKTVNEDASLNITTIFEVLDWYKQAILLTREIEIEMEAIATSRLGEVYADILKINRKANEYFLRSIQLAHSVHPKTFHGVDWFRTATKFVEKYQKERLQQETDLWQEERKKYLVELEDELNQLMEINEERKLWLTKEKDEKFLKFIYATFPTKSGHKLTTNGESIGYAELKALYRTALIHYHPDRNKKIGKKWHTLCEEIAKLLGAVYESYK